MLYSLITIVLFLAVVWWLNKTSTNDYFENPSKSDFDLIILLYSNFEIDIKTFQIAWLYFCLNPKEYNGTSVINDRWLIKGLEPFSVVHDYAWIQAKSFKNLYDSNFIYCQSLRKVNSNWLWVWGFIFVGLNLVSLFKSVKYI